MTLRPQPLRVLFVEDSRDDADLAVLALTCGGYSVTMERVERREELVAALEHGPWDIVLTDHSLPNLDSTTVAQILRSASGVAVPPPLLIVSGQIGEQAVVAAMQAGAEGYVPKDSLALLPQAAARALQNASEVRERKAAEEALMFSRVARPLVKRILLSVFESTGATAAVLMRLGQEIAIDAEQSDLDGSCRAYEEMGLGSIRLEGVSGDRFVFRGTNLFEITPEARSTTCHLALGFLSGIVSRANDGRAAPGTEVACVSRGDPECRFVIQLKTAPRVAAATETT